MVAFGYAAESGPEKKENYCTGLFILRAWKTVEKEIKTNHFRKKNYFKSSENTILIQVKEKQSTPLSIKLCGFFFQSLLKGNTIYL